MKEYLAYYDIEWYLFQVVNKRFHKDGYLSAFDFFCIVIWKSNRAKSIVARRLLKHGYAHLDEAVRDMTVGLSRQASKRDKLFYLLKSWGFRLPMATAVLTVLYPQDFTVYDIRVCDSLRQFHNLGNLTSFERVWQGYEDFLREVKKAVPEDLCLRDKDRCLWAKSFYGDLTQQITTGFAKAPKELESPS
ncbi:MAG: hypothetical protein HYX78_06850 [Armatimonadetes bacterium]|nr:hypothetical protein [Armatimonadota bacterium]